MIAPKSHLTILLADDDEEDQLFTREALQESGWPHSLYCVNDGEALLNYLGQPDIDALNVAGSLPDIILLDLNMPRMGGRETLQYLKNHPQFKVIPVVVLTTSTADQDILESYTIGANTYITKPVTFEGLVTAFKTMGNYWFTIAQLPSMRLLQ
jgi:CheY-like chemotaxis protein